MLGGVIIGADGVIGAGETGVHDDELLLDEPPQPLDPPQPQPQPEEDEEGVVGEPSYTTTV